MVANLKGLFPKLECFTDGSIYTEEYNHDLNKLPGQAHITNAGKSIKEYNIAGVKVFVGISVQNNTPVQNTPENEETA